MNEGSFVNGSMHHALPVRLVFLEMLESSQSNPIQSGRNERTNKHHFWRLNVHL